MIPFLEQSEHLQDDDDHHDRADDVQIEYIGTSFLSLYNDRSGPRSGASRSLRAGALPLDAGKRQAHHRRADSPRVLWTQIRVFRLGVRLS